MRNPLGFFRELLHQPPWIPAWVGLLMVLNLAGVAFWHEPLARWIVGTFLVSAMLMMGLYSRFGFAKILGLGHVFWLALLPWALLTLRSTAGGFRTYLLVWASATAVSLAFDIVDVWRYFNGRHHRPRPTG